MTLSPPLSTREVYQLLKDAALGVRAMGRACDQSWNDIEAGPVQVEIDGWQLTFYVDSKRLGHCSGCRAPDGRTASLDDWQRFGSNPVDLLSKWEHEQLERLLGTDPGIADHP